MENTCKVFWDEEKNSLAVTFIDEGNCEVATAHYADTAAVESLGIDAANWIANNGIMSWPDWQSAV
jgi:hypothetical protein